jgi:hypothetical protein
VSTVAVLEAGSEDATALTAPAALPAPEPPPSFPELGPSCPEPELSRADVPWL